MRAAVRGLAARVVDEARPAAARREPPVCQIRPVARAHQGPQNKPRPPPLLAPWEVVRGRGRCSLIPRPLPYSKS